MKMTEAQVLEVQLADRLYVAALEQRTIRSWRVYITQRRRVARLLGMNHLATRRRPR